MIVCGTAGLGMIFPMADESGVEFVDTDSWGLGSDGTGGVGGGALTVFFLGGAACAPQAVGFSAFLS